MSIIRRLSAAGARRRRTADATEEVERVLSARNDAGAQASLEAMRNKTPKHTHRANGG